MGFIKGMLNAETVFETVANGVDKLAFTAEEKAELNKELAGKMADFTKDTLSENSIRSKTRRFVAIAVTAVFLALVLLYVGLLYVGFPVTELKELIFESPLSNAFIMVLAFFFGGYYLKQLNLKKDKK